MVSASEVRELLDERPDLEPAVEAVLDAEPPWDFHDIDVDSGRFGELVANGVVEKTDEGYRVAEREVVERALAGEVERTSDRFDLDLPKLSLSANRLEIALVLCALALVVAFRLLSWSTVFRQGHVVLSGNDPYFYRYLVEQLLATPDVQLSALPSGLAHGEPLLVVTLWLATLALGGTPDVAGHVLAWYPVVTAALTALLVYATTFLVTDDRRIGLAAVVMLAVLPGHGMRTSLGFADHHAFDYLWLAVTLFGVVLIIWSTNRVNERLDSRMVAGIAITIIGVVAQTLAWDNSPLIIAALAPYLGFEALRAVHANDSPLRTLGPILTAIVIASAVVRTVHDNIGWHTDLVVSAPLLILLGGVGVLVAAELFHRTALPAGLLAGAELAVAAVVVFGLKTYQPEMWARLLTSIETRLIARRPIFEVQSIFSDSLGWLLLFGFILLVGLPYLVWASYRSIEDARWLPPVAYAWYFLLLAAIQARFVGQLALPLAIFAGLALVHLAERVDLARRPAPFTDAESPDLRLVEPRQATQLAVLFLLVASLSIVQVPVKTSQITTPSGLSDTAFYIAEYSEERDFDYPENYVLSNWGRNRVYNYFVNGESRSYGYARSNYLDFLGSTDPTEWYERLSPRRFVVVTPEAAESASSQIGTRLYTHHGSRTDSQPGLGHYRLIFVSAGGRYKAFELVPGAILRGQTTANGTVEVRTEVLVSGRSFTYVRETTPNPGGAYSVRVAFPGRYEVDGESVTVSQAAIWNGTIVDVPNGS